MRSNHEGEFEERSWDRVLSHVMVEPGAQGSRCLLLRAATVIVTETSEMLCGPNRAWDLWLYRSLLSSMLTTRHMWPFKLNTMQWNGKYSSSVTLATSSAQQMVGVAEGGGWRSLSSLPLERDSLVLWLRGPFKAHILWERYIWYVCYEMFWVPR